MSYKTSKVFQHVLTISDTTQSNSPSLGALVVAGGIGCLGNLSIAGTLNTTGTFSNNSTLSSTSSITGALTLAGGLGIANTTDATDYTNGGGITVAGGTSIGKRLFVAGGILDRDLLVVSSSAGTTVGGTLVLAFANNPTITNASSASSWLMQVGTGGLLSVINRNASNVATTAMSIVDTTGVLQIKSKQSASMVSLVPNREDAVEEQTFTSATNIVSTAANVTGLAFSSSRGFVVNLVVFINATTPVSVMYELRGIRLGTGIWDLSSDMVSGDTAAVTVSFGITAGGQVQYTKVDTAGHVSTTIKWRTLALYD